jgi:hypothetical protein
MRLQWNVRDLVVRLPIDRSKAAIAISDHDVPYCRINSDIADVVAEVNGSSRKLVGTLIKTPYGKKLKPQQERVVIPSPGIPIGYRLLPPTVKEVKLQQERRVILSRHSLTEVIASVVR